jgi:uncharacterized protein YbjT (DUF2867 family)
MNDTAKVYLITGATGTVGSDLVAKLAQADPHNEIRCATRDAKGESAERIRTAGPNVVPTAFDTARSETLEAAFGGATHVYLLPPFLEKMVQWQEQVIAAAKASGTVQHVVKHSVMGARAPTPDSMPSPVPLMHYRGEECLASSGLTHCVIRPTIFAQHFSLLPWVYEPGADAFQLPIGSARVAFLDARDIATLAVHLLTRPDSASYNGRVFQLTGPAALDGPEISKILSRVAGRTIRYLDPNEGDYRRRIESFGVSGFALEQLTNVYHDCKEGWLGKYLSEDYPQELGTPATTFAQFAQDHVAHFLASA